MYKLSIQIYLKRVYFGVRQIFYGCKSLVKLRCRRPNFKVTLKEMPSVKSCSTSIYLGFPSFLKMSGVYDWLNFEINLVRGPYEHPIEQTKQTVKSEDKLSEPAKKRKSEQIEQA